MPQTFLSDSVYRESARFWRGTGLLYLFVVLVFASLVMAGAMVYHLKSEIRAELPYFLSSFPELQLRGGRLSLVEAAPPVILNLQGQEAVIIDPSGAISTLEGQAAAILVTDREVRIRWLAGKELPVNFGDVKDMRIGREEVRRFVEEALGFFPVLLFPVAYVTMLLTSCLWWSVQALFYTMISTMILFRGIGQPPFSACLRVICLALTPAIGVKTLFMVFAVTSAWAELFIVLVEVAYVFLAMRNSFKGAGIVGGDIGNV